MIGLDGSAGHDSSAHATDCYPHDHIRTRRRRRPQPLTRDRLAEAIRRYGSGETLKQIATDLGVSRTFLRGTSPGLASKCASNR